MQKPGRMIGTLLLATGLLCIAQAKKTTAKGDANKEPKLDDYSGYALLDTILIKDVGCAKDYAKARHAEGIERRKMLADLFEYGCIELLRLVYAVIAPIHELGVRRRFKEGRLPP